MAGVLQAIPEVRAFLFAVPEACVGITPATDFKKAIDVLMRYVHSPEELNAYLDLLEVHHLRRSGACASRSILEPNSGSCRRTSEAQTRYWT